MRLIYGIPLAVILLANLCWFVAAEMTKKSCEQLYDDSNANWEHASQVFECDKLLPHRNHLFRLKESLENSTKHSNCNDEYKRWSIHHNVNLENDMIRDEKQPSSIKRAFIAYGLRLSASCRWSLINLIKRKKLEAILTDDDYAVLDGWINENGPLARLFGIGKENKGLALPKAMVKLLKARKQSDILAIRVEVPPNTTFELAHIVCNRRFRPIYKQVGDPLIEMAMNGFNYEPEGWQLDAETTKKLQQWDRAVFVCKLMETMNVVENATLTAGQVRLTEERSSYSQLLAKASKYYPEVKNVEFNYDLVDGRKSCGDDRLVDAKDSQLMKAIKKYHEPSVSVGLKAVLKMAGSTLAQKVSNVFGNSKADQDDKGITDFLADYTKKVDTANMRLPELKRKAGDATQETVFKMIYYMCPLCWAIKSVARDQQRELEMRQRRAYWNSQ